MKLPLRPMNVAQWHHQRQVAIASQRHLGRGGVVLVGLSFLVMVGGIFCLPAPFAEPSKGVPWWFIPFVIGTAVGALMFALSLIDGRPRGLTQARPDAEDLAQMERWKTEPEVGDLLGQVNASGVPLLHQDLITLRGLFEHYQDRANQLRMGRLLTQI